MTHASFTPDSGRLSCLAANPWVAGAGPGGGIEVTGPDLAWPRQYDRLASRICQALGWRVLQLEHVGSTAVPGLAAKPVIDIDLTVADPERERDYVPALEKTGFQLMIREPWWHGHRMLRADEPSCNLHVFGFDSPELVKHRIFRDWLRATPASVTAAPPQNARPRRRRMWPASTSCTTTSASSRSSAGSTTRAFAAAGLLEP